MTSDFLHSDVFVWGILPFLIFLAQLFIVSLGTIRIILLSKGQKIFSACLGFFEVLIWLLAVAQIVQNVTNPLYYIVYALGFATGNFVGIWLEEKLAMGILLVRVITKKEATKLIRNLRARKFRLTSVAARGESGKVNVLYVILKRKNLPSVMKTIRKFHPKSFFSVEDVRFVSEGAFPLPDGGFAKRFGFFRRER